MSAPIRSGSLPANASAVSPTDDTGALVRAAAAPATPGRFDELRGRCSPEAGADPVPAADALEAPLSASWQRFFEVEGVDVWRDLASRRASVQRKVQEDGATYNLHARAESGSRAWPLEVLPLLLAPEEWAGIERGVVQRARLLEAALKDIYGEQCLLREGLLPGALIHGHPQYLRPMHGALAGDAVGLHLIALDLARGPEGRWWVVGHRTQSPSGLGYLLENRLIISRQFPEAFRALRVQRIAATFRALVEGLVRASGAGPQARLALLTPGRHNETYFEHVFLARYLGLTLVEGSDLTVRDQRVYLKTLQGLERVHVLLRRVDDEWLDPLELKPESALGVPGLLQAVRAREVIVANLPGAGVLESPGLSAFWPAVAQRLLDEPLLLPATTSWWCGEASVWAAQREHLAKYMIVPTFPGGDVTRSFDPVTGGSLDAAGLAALRARIDEDPAAHTLIAPVRPSELPVWRMGRIQPRPLVLRVFAARDSDGRWAVLPGGLTRIARRKPAAVSGDPDVYLSMQRGSASTSTDTWVMTRGQVDHTTLLPRPLQPADLEQVRWVITSRSAENLFWFGRYTERAEATIRMARLMLDALPAANLPVIRVLHGLLQRNGVIDPALAAPLVSSAQALRVFERAVLRSMSDGSQGSGLAYNLRALKVCASSLRERLSPEHWGLIDDFDAGFERRMARVRGQHGRETIDDMMSALERASARLSAITGAQTDRMTRDDGWRLLSVGRQIERLDTLAHTLAVCFESGLMRSDDGFALMLALFDSTITYRARYQARREVLPLLHLLVLDSDNPRSIAWVARTMRERLAKLARHDPEWANAVCAPLPRPDEWRMAALCEAVQGRFVELESRLRGCSDAALALSAEIGRHLFSHVAVSDRTVWQ